MTILYIVLLFSVAILCVFFAVKIRTFLKVKRAAAAKEARDMKDAVAKYIGSKL